MGTSGTKRMQYRTVILSMALLSTASLGILVAHNSFGASTVAPGLVPLPQKVEMQSGSFRLQAQTVIRADVLGRDSAEFLAARLRPATGYPFSIETNGSPSSIKGAVCLTTNQADAALGEEGYKLEVASDSVVIRAAGSAGFFYGVQTLLQLAPPEVWAARSGSNVAWDLPAVRIEDRPRFRWRGFMLDVSRHFFDKAEVEQVLDSMAALKLNRFHWHLVDDQGWRIQIKQYPRLAEIGAWRKEIGFKLDPKASHAYGPDGRYGGFYTQDDIREVVAYARARHITVVPEIEMPGHSTAALAAYPQLSCLGGPFTTDLNGGIFAGVYCPGKEETFQFLQNVLGEVMELFPGPYIHIGGDEVPVDNWKKCTNCQARMREQGMTNESQLESYLIRRIEPFINAHGHTLVGWSEIREGGLAQNAVVMDWIGGALEAARAGHDVVLSPTKFCYLDYYQSTNRAAEPRAIGGYLPLKKVYAFEPVPADLEPANQFHIQGGQANLWTEYVPSLQQVQYMMFPRLCALAEVVWSPAEKRDYTDFTRRLAAQNQRLEQAGINYRRQAGE